MLFSFNIEIMMAIVVVISAIVVVIMSSYMMMMVILEMFMVNMMFILIDTFVGSRRFDWHVDMLGRVGHRLVINMGSCVPHGFVVDVSLSVSHWLILHFSRVIFMLCLRCIMMRMSIVVLLDNTCAEWFRVDIFVMLSIMRSAMIFKDRMCRVMYISNDMVYI